MLVAGDQIDVWIVERALGSGGMGSVYRCRNRNANRISAAVKVLDSDLRRFPEAEARFIREAEILFRLDHPNIVKVRNVRTDLDPPFLEMEFVEGESLEDRLRRGPIPLGEAVLLFAQLVSALAYLHASGVRHRDIKPANVLVKSDGQLKLVDFGLAMEAEATRLTQNGLAFGTVSYAPPEWLAPETLDAARWDVYAAGVVFHEMLTGELAFPVLGIGSARQQAAQVIFAKQGHAPLDPGPAFPGGLRELIGDATCSDAAKRIADGPTLWARLRSAVPALELPSGWNTAPVPRAQRPAGTTPLPEGPSSPTHSVQVAREPPARTGRRIAWIVGVAAGLGALAVAAVVAISLGVWFLSSRSAPQPREVVARVAGLPADMPFTVKLNGVEPHTRNQSECRFSAPPGPGLLTWTVGEGCAAGCPGQGCPAWCSVGEQAIELPIGSEPFEVAVAVRPPTPRRVDVALPPLDAATPVAVVLGKRAALREGTEMRIADVPPGEHAIEASIGTCPPDARGCFPDRSCPRACLSYVGTLIVPLGDGPWRAPLDLSPAPEPERAPAGGPAPAVAAQPRPEAAPRSGRGAGGIITMAQFASWLAGNPEWQPEQLAVSGYLPGWSAATPPAGSAPGAPVLALTWAAARAYCSDRGGLPSIDAEPTTWTGEPQLEWRKSADGKYAHRFNDGEAGTAGHTNRPLRGVGFRCAR